MQSIPVTIITGFLGSGKTTVLLNLIPQLQAKNPNYKLALLKNEFGDLAIDSQLANSSSITGVREILNGCICCNLVGSLSTALEELSDSISPNRIIIETSGSAFPATLAIEVNRLAREKNGKYVVDGVVTVIDVENWKGYEDTSYTARLQARYTDLIIFNKWEEVDERRWEECLDRLGDIEVEIAWVKSQRGWVDMNIILGLDKGLARNLEDLEAEFDNQHEKMHEKENHQSEVEVLSITLSFDYLIESSSSSLTSTSVLPAQNLDIDTTALLKFLQSAPKDEIYRIKSIFTSLKSIPPSGPSDIPLSSTINSTKYILNWSFGRWTCTPFSQSDSKSIEDTSEHPSSVAIGQGKVFLRMVLILSQDSGKKWKKKLENENLIRFDDKTTRGGTGKLSVVLIT